MVRLPVLPLAFYRGVLSEDITNTSDKIVVPIGLYNRWADAFYGGNLLFRLGAGTGAGTAGAAEARVVSFGAAHTEADNWVFVPEWILAHLDIFGANLVSGHMVEISPVSAEIPVIQKLQVSILSADVNPLEHEEAIRGGLERLLYTHHTIQRGTTMTIPGGWGGGVGWGGAYDVSFIVDEVLPCEGGVAILTQEVSVEIQWPFWRPPTPPPAAPAVLLPSAAETAPAPAPEDRFPWLKEPSSWVGQGRRLDAPAAAPSAPAAPDAAAAAATRERMRLAALQRLRGDNTA